jgi:hypothetical protein
MKSHFGMENNMEISSYFKKLKTRGLSSTREENLRAKFFLMVGFHLLLHHRGGVFDHVASTGC